MKILSSFQRRQGTSNCKKCGLKSQEINDDGQKWYYKVN